MSAFLQKSGGRGKRSLRRESRVMSEINVTPMVDVMLVLLIIFMVAAPLMTVGVSVDLPEVSAPAINEDVEPLTISIDKEGKIFVQETPVDLETLVPKLKAITGEKQDSRLFIRGDQSLTYGRIMKVMGALNEAGFSRVALLAELPVPKRAVG
ncbi:MAG: protein TolR [bacterium]|nr:protein TolR [bacterium]